MNKYIKAERGVKRPPLISFTEVAKKYGVTVPELRGVFKRLRTPPKPKIIHHHRTAGKQSNSWYDRREMGDFLRPWLDQRGHLDLAKLRGCTTLNDEGANVQSKGLAATVRREDQEVPRHKDSSKLPA